MLTLCDRAVHAGDEPRVAVLCAWFIAQACLFIGDLNAVASIISGFFLLVYFFTNLACFVLRISGTCRRPWRPRPPPTCSRHRRVPAPVRGSCGSSLTHKLGTLPLVPQAPPTSALASGTSRGTPHSRVPCSASRSCSSLGPPTPPFPSSCVARGRAVPCCAATVRCAHATVLLVLWLQVVALLWIYVHYTAPVTSWGDVTQALIYHQVSAVVGHRVVQVACAVVRLTATAILRATPTPPRSASTCCGWTSAVPTPSSGARLSSCWCVQLAPQHQVVWRGYTHAAATPGCLQCQNPTSQEARNLIDFGNNVKKGGTSRRPCCCVPCVAGWALMRCLWRVGVCAGMYVLGNVVITDRGNLRSIGSKMTQLRHLWLDFIQKARIKAFHETTVGPDSRSAYVPPQPWRAAAAPDGTLTSLRVLLTPALTVPPGTKTLSWPLAWVA